MKAEKISNVLEDFLSSRTPTCRIGNTILYKPEEKEIGGVMIAPVCKIRAEFYEDSVYDGSGKNKRAAAEEIFEAGRRKKRVQENAFGMAKNGNGRGG